MLAIIGVLLIMIFFVLCRFTYRFEDEAFVVEKYILYAVKIKTYRIYYKDIETVHKALFREHLLPSNNLGCAFVGATAPDYVFTIRTKKGLIKRYIVYVDNPDKFLRDISKRVTM